jgi:hypothetical protein
MLRQKKATQLPTNDGNYNLKLTRMPFGETLRSLRCAPLEPLR